MAEDIASLGIRVDSSGVAQGTQNLDQLADAAERAQDAASGVGDAVKKAGTEAASAGQAASVAGRGFTQQGQSVQVAAQSAKQYSQALRPVPAQINDVVAGLVRGQPAYTTAIRQGGLLRDSFGVTTPAVRAFGGALAGLTSPLALAAGALGLLAVRAHSAQADTFLLERAVIMSGQAAHVSAEQLADMAFRLDRVSGTQRAAVRVLSEMASTGRIAGASLEQAAEAALRLQSVAGVSTEETIRNLVALSDKPYEAAKRLDQQIHFLNASTLERIRLLQEEGRNSEATRIAQSAYAEAMIRRTDELGGKVGWLQQLTTGLRKAFAELWDNVGGGVVSREEELERLQRRLQEVRGAPQFSMGMGPGEGLFFGSERDIENRIAQIQREQISEQRFKDAIAASQDQFEAFTVAQDHWSKIEEANLSRRERMEREIAEIRKAGLAARKDEAAIERQVAAVRERYITAPTTKANADDSSARSLIETIQRQVEANQILVTVGEKATAGDRLAITARQMLADTTNTMTGATRNLLASMLPTLDASEKAAEAAVREQRAKEALSRQNAVLAQQASNTRAANELQLMSVGRGQDSVDQLQRRIEISRQYEAELRRLGDRAVAEDQAVWDQMADNAKAHRDRMLAEESDFQRQRAAAMGDPLQGATAAWEDFAFSVRDVSSQAYDLVSGAFDEAGEAVARFAQTGELSFSNLTNSILADLTRLGANKLLMTLLGSLTPLGEVQGAGTRIVPNANGNVYAAPALSDFSGQVVNQPTLFAFAKGAGVMGEAGAEGILPLKRNASGQLGVIAMGGGGGEVNVHIHGAPSTPTVNKRRNASGGFDIDVVFKEMESWMADRFASGASPFNSVMRGRYGMEAI